MSEKNPCPKCGEPNEIERTYCWVCYTAFNPMAPKGTPPSISLETPLKEASFHPGKVLVNAMSKLIVFGFMALGAIVLLMLLLCSTGYFLSVITQ